MGKQENKGEFSHVELYNADVEQIRDQLEDVAVSEAEIEIKHMEKEADAEFEEELKALMQEDTSKNKKSKNKGSRKKWSKKKKVLIFAILAIVVVFGISKVMGGNKAPQMMVATAPLAKGEVVQMLSLNGPVSGTDSVDVVSNLHAEILELMVKEGDKVTKGQLLAILDSSDIQKEVEIAQNAYDLAVSTYKEQGTQAQNGYEKAVQDYNSAKGNYDRTSALQQAGSASLVELETARNTMNDARRALSSYSIKDGKAVANESYELDVKNKEFALQQKKDDLDNTQIKSAIDGTVVRVNSKVGRFADKIEDEKPLFIIENLDVLEMKINVSEYSIGSIKLGQKATIKADILNGETVEGEVTAISPTGEEKGSGSTERVIPTTVKILEDNTKLIAGITAKAEIVLNQATDAWVIPIGSLIQQPDGTNAVATVENGLIKLIPVDTGVESDIQIEILPKDGAALTEGMAIIANPQPGLTDGMAVTVMPSAQ